MCINYVICFQPIPASSTSHSEMPHTYIYTRKKQRQYTDEDLRVAAQEVWDKKLTISAAARQFGVPCTT